MKYLIPLAASLAVLTGCATPTPYQPALEGRWGFDEQQIETDRYRLSFRGNAQTDRETVETYILYRCAELTLERGYDHFVIAQRGTSEESRIIGTGRDPFFHPGFGMRYSYFHPRAGWLYANDPFWNDIDYREITRYEASAEIVFGRGPKPAMPNAFDARDVVANLGDDIVRPDPR